jgi:SOS response regulatory protein OraA/RecX
MLGQEKADWIKELEENEVLKEIRKREVDEIVGEASKISFKEGVEYGQELGIKKGREERRKLLQKIIAQLRAEGFSDQKIQSMLNIDPEDL